MSLYHQLREWKNGNKEVVEDILALFHPTIRKLSSGLYYEEAETDMIIKFLELISKLDLRRFRDADDKQIFKYIHKYLRNRSLDLFRKHKSRDISCIHVDCDLLIEQRNSYVENTVLISMLIASLNPFQREVITRKYIYGFSDREIAKQVGKSRQAINRIRKKALRGIRKNLESN